jgi:aspartyl-tRNA(Asn)/glutamyl-tRNA(Gln) amidotransferase subunit C
MITKETVRHIAKLARLKLTAQEEDMYTEQLGKILDHVEELQAVDTTGIEPAAHVLPISNIMREDEVKPCQTQEMILKEAPDKEKNFFRVPKIGD